MTTWEAVIPGRPTSKGNSKRAFRGVVVMPAHVKRAEENARGIIYQQRPPAPFTGPIILDVEFRFAIPKHSQATKTKPAKLHPGEPCTRKVDRGNLLKLIEDSANGIVYVDDSQIVGGDVSKKWWDRDETYVVVRALKEQERGAA